MEDNISKTTLNYQRLLLLISTLLIIVCSFVLIKFILDNRITQPLTAKISSENSFESNIPENSLNIFVDSSDLKPIKSVEPYYSLGVVLKEAYKVDWDQFLKDLQTFSNVADDQANFQTNYKCINLKNVVSDTRLKFKNGEVESKYRSSKDAFITYLNIPKDKVKSSELMVSDICENSYANFIEVSIYKIFESSKPQGFYLQLAKKVYAGGGLLPGYDKYLIIIPKNEIKPTFISIFSYYDPTTGMTYGNGQEKLQTFTSKELNNPNFTQNEGITTNSGAYFGYARISEVGLYNDYLVLGGSSGDGCCGTQSLRLLNIKSGLITELYGCMYDLNRDLCKDFQGKIYYSKYKEPLN